MQESKITTSFLRLKVVINDLLGGPKSLFLVYVIEKKQKKIYQTLINVFTTLVLCPLPDNIGIALSKKIQLKLQNTAHSVV